MPSVDLDMDELRAALSYRVIGKRIVYLDSVSSTMDEARRIAETGEPEGTVVVAEEQTAARGRFNRAWISPPGVNVVFSVLLRPSPAQLPHVNMAAALAVSKTVEHFTGLVPSTKWPNDVRLRGRKISGILVEAAMQGTDAAHAVVGIGINVNFDTSYSKEISSTATSMMTETGGRFGRGEVLQHVLEGMDDLYGRVSRGESLTVEWSTCLETLGQTVRLEWNGNVVEGFAEAVDERGNLVLSSPDGSTFTAVAGEVTLQSGDGAEIKAGNA